MEERLAVNAVGPSVSEPYRTFGCRLVRYVTALVVLVYGFAKLNGAQFTILDSELDKPMGQVSGFWLTWYYFGYSPVYGNLLGLAEVCGALLLTFPRSTLLGAAILAPVLGNIVLIDVCFGVDPGAAIIACLLLIACLWLVSFRRAELMATFWPAGIGSVSGAAKWIVRFAMVALTFGFTWWTANYNNRLPTPLDGAWDVVRAEPASLEPELPERVFFEYNRAYMVVFRARDGSCATHHFEVETKAGTIRVWREWLSKGAPVFSGTWTVAGPDLVLAGTLADSRHAVLHLHRRISR